MSAVELVAGWDGEALRPLRQSQKAANENLVIGERYIVTAIEPRSAKSHRFYFAVLGEAFKNLPETVSDQFDSVEHLRKRALIETGWRRERRFVESSHAQAQRLAKFLSEGRDEEDFAVISVNGSVVIEWRARSQKERAMGRDDFEKSKNDVISWVADLIGVPEGALTAQHRQLLPPPRRGRLSPALDVAAGDALPVARDGSAPAPAAARSKPEGADTLAPSGGEAMPEEGWPMYNDGERGIP